MTDNRNWTIAFSATPEHDPKPHHLPAFNGISTVRVAANAGGTQQNDE